MTASLSSPAIPDKYLKFKITAAHIQAMNMRFQNKTYSQISEVIGIKEGTIRNWFAVSGVCYEAYKEYCHNLINPVAPAVTTTQSAINVAERIKQLAPEAIEVIGALAKNAKREQVKYQASADILDRAGYAPVQKNININHIEEMSSNDLTSLVDGILGEHGLHIKQDALEDKSNSEIIEGKATYSDSNNIDIPSDTDSCAQPGGEGK